MMDLGMSHDTPLQRFAWPVDGWFRGFRVELVDGQGKVVPRHVMHHMIMVNFSRRQLLYSGGRAFDGRGHRNRGRVSVPKTIGVPMKPGMKLGMYIAWHNDTGKDLEGGLPQAHHAVDAEEPEPPAGELAADLHGREPDGGRHQYVRRAAGKVDQGLRVHPARSAAGSWAWAGTCTTTARGCGWRMRRPGR